MRARKIEFMAYVTKLVNKYVPLRDCREVTVTFRAVKGRCYHEKDRVCVL
jgi:hypothetical protein